MVTYKSERKQLKTQKEATPAYIRRHSLTTSSFCGAMQLVTNNLKRNWNN